MKIAVDNPKAVIEEAFWLAWQACGGPMGMGVFQDRAGATKEEVVANVTSAGDYSAATQSQPGEMYGDYVFGRMMKLSLQFTDTEVDVPEGVPRGNYQSWCGTYESYEALIRAAIESIAQ